jgi:hypothetical protein
VRGASALAGWFLAPAFAAVAGLCLLSGACTLSVDLDGLAGDPTLDSGDGTTTGQDGPASPPPEGGASDVGADSDTGGPSPCTSAILCDDFETPVIDKARWSVSQEYNGSIVVDGTHANSGQRALHAHTIANPDAGGSYFAFIGHAGLLPSHVFIRMFVYQPPVVASSPIQYVAVSATATGEPPLQILDSMGLRWQYESFGAGFTNYSSTLAAEAVPTNAWTCVEWEIDRDANKQRLYVGGAKLADMEVAITGFAGNLVTLGLAQGPAPVVDVWLDDVVVSASRVGCSF